MSKKNKNGQFYSIAILCFLIGIGGLLYAGFTTNSVYFLNVQEALAASPEKLQKIRLFGTVAEKNILKDPNTPGVSFLLEDKDDQRLTIPVQYRGAVPDAFKAGAEVIVEGGMQANNKFFAKTLMTKCPSKYQKENRK